MPTTVPNTTVIYESCARTVSVDAHPDSLIIVSDRWSGSAKVPDQAHDVWLSPDQAERLAAVLLEAVAVLSPHPLTGRT